MENNTLHLMLRYTQRVGMQYQAEVRAVLCRVDRLAKLRKLPNSQWYRCVRVEGRVVCYVCGTGNYVATILAANMVPKGKEV